MRNKVWWNKYCDETQVVMKHKVLLKSKCDKTQTLTTQNFTKKMWQNLKLKLKLKKENQIAKKPKLWQKFKYD